MKKTFKIKTNIYPLQAIMASCYNFLDRAYFFLDGDPKKEIIVNIEPKGKIAAKKFDALIGQFKDDLVFSALRNKISSDNKKIREYLVGRAMFSLVPEEESDLDLGGDPNDDPLGIAVPWEEAHGKGKDEKKEK